MKVMVANGDIIKSLKVCFVSLWLNKHENKDDFYLLPVIVIGYDVILGVKWLQ